ncbi:MAG TPA: endonuclease III [Chloroflexota bacterium]|nr:endonuclease III [Chloroflexota bacterium]
MPQVQGQGEGLTRATEITRRLRVAYGIDEPERHEEDDPVGALVGTILSQHTSDVNSDRAYDSMLSRFPTWEAVRTAPEGELAASIRSGGLANLKARRIKRCLDAIVERFGGLDLSSLAGADLDEARARLRELPGVGPKTAACVLLFSLGRPAIPVDTHVHRVSRRLGLIGPKTSAEAAHAELERVVRPEDAYAFHVGLVTHGRRVCRAGRPLCSLCPLTDLCDAYLGVAGAAG